MRINTLAAAPVARPFRSTPQSSRETVVSDQFQASGARLPEQRSPLLNPTTQLILGMALHKAVQQGGTPSCLTDFRLDEQSANSKTEVKAHIWQNQGIEGDNSHLQGKVGERSYNGQFYSTCQTDGVHTTYTTPYCDFQDQAELCTRQEDGATVTRLDGVLDNQEAHLTSRLMEVPGREGTRCFRLNTVGDLGGQSYQANTDFIINLQAGPQGEMGSAVTNGYQGHELFKHQESWTGRKPHAVLNEIHVQGQGQIAGVAVASKGQFTVRDDDNAALSINKLLPGR